jgi:hypothetical protein
VLNSACDPLANNRAHTPTDEIEFHRCDHYAATGEVPFTCDNRIEESRRLLAPFQAFKIG